MSWVILIGSTVTIPHHQVWIHEKSEESKELNEQTLNPNWEPATTTLTSTKSRTRIDQYDQQLHSQHAPNTGSNCNHNPLSQRKSLATSIFVNYCNGVIFMSVHCFNSKCTRLSCFPFWRLFCSFCHLQMKLPDWSKSLFAKFCLAQGTGSCCQMPKTWNLPGDSP